MRASRAAPSPWPCWRACAATAHPSRSDAGGGKEIAIPAGKLVKWVKEARGKSSVADAEDTSESFKPKDKDEAYLADVMEGIAALIGSGRVEGMPYKVNGGGQAENFSQGVPDSLRLATKSYGAGGDERLGEIVEEGGRAGVDDVLGTLLAQEGRTDGIDKG